jgi:hypothetical protein
LAARFHVCNFVHLTITLEKEMVANSIIFTFSAIGDAAAPHIVAVAVVIFVR